ncbi:DUF551 domain-containing protein [Escherichia albertii]|uniref:DUF551 domain-containing protein n=1 Tax=Escherichia albertii TaxID=208962 RepID=UPI001375001A|nr:DUF551 domain-containing protein [Escherichia albertii]MCE7723235.1 DUF551 domain-containing protein [Escherichia albertii]MCE7727598.1 DUF551 domain-containing protein [Escherichia albertii]MCU7292047.1 DUF551 domain-containing protein [Escherichia albertii]QTA14646.1 DUF551 domain-containing protein [Escherichia albertii]HAX3035058.1 DUF551 domain-containing protein [Escherichia albertii]
MINRTKLEHILEYARQQRRFSQLCKILPGDMVEIVEIAMRKTGNSPVSPGGWISCSDRMPNDAQWCVVNTEYGYYVQCWSEGQGWLGDDISIPECDVINWMPLPEPPQQDGE